MPKRGLPSGAGLKDLHYVEELTKASRAVGRTIPVDRIEPNPDQPRTEMGNLEELADSIRQRGVLEPILVVANRERGTWTIVAGERRWRAACLAGLSEIPCIELDLSENDVAEIALIENLQRKDLTVWEEADGLAALVRRFGYTHDEIAKKIGRSRSSVTEALAIANLPERVRQRCVQMNINAKSTLLEVARQFDEKAMMEFLSSLEASGSFSREQARKISVRTKSSSKKLLNREKKVYSFSRGGFRVELFSSNESFSRVDLECFLRDFFSELERRLF
ncbi:MAG: ParB/RepB/Spo0J family partition protein [Pyrinomonadaceae bacterium]|nr:ParB/RepB/Spo0J family partition protein [Pyrinomonadaceae bacterium]MCX7640997.1 ParB/RepB/Spo0J family partition protein [Pyrinomonadaceae bacterium]MDW8305079.1 ParB/RepB/Spo0J family partition protein [Acidobacteriota bacterium]